MRRIYGDAHKEMMKWYQQESKLQDNDIKNYFTQVHQAEIQGDLLKQVLQEKA